MREKTITIKQCEECGRPEQEVGYDIFFGCSCLCDTDLVPKFLWVIFEQERDNTEEGWEDIDLEPYSIFLNEEDAKAEKKTLKGNRLLRYSIDKVENDDEYDWQ